MTKDQTYSPPHRMELKNDPANAKQLDAAQPQTTIALKMFLSEIAAAEKAFILDMGCICDRNIDFFVQRRCRVFVDDLLQLNLRIRKRQNARIQVVDELPEDFNYPDELFDGVLCWEAFDHLGAKATRVLVQKIWRMLKPGGCALALFAPANLAANVAIRYRILNEEELRYEPLDLGLPPRNCYQNRDIVRLFGDFASCDSYILRNGWREAIARK